MSQATPAERYFLGLVNDERASHGLKPLMLETRLNNSSNAHTQWMLQQDVFSHTGADGSKVKDRVLDANFPLEVSWRVAENLAYGSVDRDGSIFDEVDQLHRNLMNSPSHRANILDPDVEYIGIGLQVGEFNGHQVLMATQNFASTEGHLRLDVAPDVTIATVDRPFQGIMSKSTWLEANGPVTRGPVGTAGNDHIVKGPADNTLNGAAGDDLISGGGGNDRLRGGMGNDMIQGQRGNDRVAGDMGNDILKGGIGNDTLLGGGGRDQLNGEGGHDRLLGHKGNDRLLGGLGNDSLLGGQGQDTLIGGPGSDVLTGGAGADHFVFQGNTGADRITDFTPGQDRLLIAEGMVPDHLPDFFEDQIVKTRDGVMITLSEGNRILVEGSDLTVQDVADDIFLF